MPFFVGTLFKKSTLQFMNEVWHFSWIYIFVNNPKLYPSFNGFFIFNRHFPILLENSLSYSSSPSYFGFEKRESTGYCSTKSKEATKYNSISLNTSPLAFWKRRSERSVHWASALWMAESKSVFKPRQLVFHITFPFEEPLAQKKPSHILQGRYFDVLRVKVWNT